MSAEAILQLNEDNFDERIRGFRGPVLVDFWAAWCTPCKTIAHSLERVADELDGRAHVAKVDVVENGDLANRFGIRSVPTLIVFKGGKVVDQMIGAAPVAEIRRLLDRHID